MSLLIRSMVIFRHGPIRQFHTLASAIMGQLMSLMVIFRHGPITTVSHISISDNESVDEFDGNLYTRPDHDSFTH